MPRTPIVAILALLVLSGAAVAAAFIDARATPEEETIEISPEPAAAPSGHGHAGAHPWSGGKGTIPTLADAMLTLDRRAKIDIRGDAAFNPANGVRSGSGTFEDPFVISGWFVDTIRISDTSKAFEIKENYVSEILVLDWTANGGYVHHNLIENLRTNRNIVRTGDPTAAVIEFNEIHRVEELRHFDGEVRQNVIGVNDSLPLLRESVVFNIAGLNGAGIHDNLIYGGVDMKIHGHHHSDAPGAGSHNHGAADETQADGREEMHQVRYVDFMFYGNRIVDDGFGLRYNDLNHAGDDRQATSEQEPRLEDAHVHHTRVTLKDNVIDGATLRVSILNSPDERHLAGETGELHVVGNRILKPLAGDGIVVSDVSNARVEVHGNTVERGTLQLSGTSAILLARFTNATVAVDENTFGAYAIGVRARNFDANTTWIVGENRGPVDQPVYWDESVANAPGTPADADAHADHGHSHEPEGPPPSDEASTDPALTSLRRLQHRH